VFGALAAVGWLLCCRSVGSGQALGVVEGRHHAVAKSGRLFRGLWIQVLRFVLQVDYLARYMRGWRISHHTLFHGRPVHELHPLPFGGLQVSPTP
jgi:hypothetical protein